MADGVMIVVTIITGLITLLLLRAREMTWWGALSACLFGFYLGSTPMYGVINTSMTAFTNLFI